MTQKIDALVQSSLLKAATINEHFKHDPKDVAAALTTSMTDPKGEGNTPKIHVKERKSVIHAHKKLSHNGFNDEEKSHVSYYTGPGSKHINQSIIEDHTSGRIHSSVLHAGLQSIIAKAPKLKRDTHVYSGLGYRPKDVKFGVGSVIHLPAYTSSSINVRKASTFADAHIEHEEGKGGYHILHFHLPKGYNKGTYIGDHSKHKTENEFLLDHNQKWKIHSHQEVGSQHIWTLKPHDEKLNEALVHRPMSLRSLTRSKSVKRLSTDGWHETVSATQQQNPPAIANHQSNATADGSKHSDKLSDIQFSGHKPSTLEKTHDEHKILYQYSKSHFSRMVNNHLIEKSQKDYGPGRRSPEYGDTTPEERDVHVETLSNHIKKHAMPLPEESHMYSGVKFDMKALAAKNKTFHTPAFTSTSTTLETAKGFSGATSKTSTNTKDDSKGHLVTSDTRTVDRHIIHFKLPKGYNKGMHVAPISDYPEEHEYLLNHSQNWKITGHKRVSYTHFSNYRTLKAGSNEIAYLGKNKDITHYHIWTVEPHDEHIKEAFKHDPNAFRSLYGHVMKSSGEHGPWGSDTKKVKTKLLPPHASAAQDENKRDAYTHHTKLADLQYGGKQNEYSRYYNEDHPPIHGYTTESNELNLHLIHASQNKYHTNQDISVEDHSHDINHHKRMGEIADTLSNHIKKHAMPLPEESHMYSGVKFDMHKVAAQSKVFHTPAFTSTSVNPQTAGGFAGAFEHPDNHMTAIPGAEYDSKSLVDKHVLHFKLPKGYKGGMYAAPASRHPDEYEYILDKGQKWKITGHKRVNQVNFSKINHTKGADPEKLYSRSRSVQRVHIWTVEPHDEHIKEAFDHVDDTKTLTDTKNMSPGQFKFNPKHQEEHEHLSALHTAAAKPYNLSLRRFSMMSNELNTSLINGEKISPIWSGVHEKIQTMFKSTPALTKEHHVYTGLGDFDPSEHLKHSAGVFKTKSYMSTSISPDIAIGHSNIKSFGTDNEHVIHFHLPAGYKGGHYIADHSMVKGEHEMLLNHGQKFKVTAHNKYSIKRPDGSDATRHVWSVTPHE